MNTEKRPVGLRHKAMYIADEYNTMDGEYKNNSDVWGLSIGKAQWRSGTPVFEPSVKVLRIKNGRFSPQSEETTFTRALDMATFVIKVYSAIRKGEMPKGFCSVHDNIQIEKIKADYDAEMIDYLTRNKEDIDEHIKYLQRTIKESGI